MRESDTAKNMSRDDLYEVNNAVLIMLEKARRLNYFTNYETKTLQPLIKKLDTFDHAMVVWKDYLKEGIDQMIRHPLYVTNEQLNVLISMAERHDKVYGIVCANYLRDVYQFTGEDLRLLKEAIKESE